MDVDTLFESIYTVFKEEVFEIIPRLKFKYYNDGSISQKEAQVIYPTLSNDKDVQLILFNHLNCWLPSIVLYDAKYNTDTFNVHFYDHISSMKLATRDLIFSPNNDLEMENVAFDVIQCLFGCLDEMKDLLSKNDDFSSSLLFPAYKYRAVHLLMFLKGILKMVNLNYIEKSKNIDYLPVIDFGEFLVNGHSHPFDPHIFLVLKILKNRCTENILIKTLSSIELVFNPENRRLFESDQLNRYIKIVSKITDLKLKEGFSFSDEFYSILFNLVVFNSNTKAIVGKEKFYLHMKKILRSICENQEEAKNVFINFLDSNFKHCITDGLVSSIIGMTYLQIKRPFSKFIELVNFDSLVFNEPSFYKDFILSNGHPDSSSTCYDTLFVNVSNLVACLCINYSDKDCREVIWDYLINNTKKRIDECPTEKRLELASQLFNQFSANYNFEFISLLFESKPKQKEIESIIRFIFLFADKQSKYGFVVDEKAVVDHLIFFSKHSFDALKKSFDFLIQKVPEKLKEDDFISDALSNRISAKDWNLIEKLCLFGFEGKTKSEIGSILNNSEIVGCLIKDLNVLNFIYDNGIIQDRFVREDEEQLSFPIVSIKLMMKYKDCFEMIIKKNDKKQILELSSSLLISLEKCEIKCPMKDELINAIFQFIS